MSNNVNLIVLRPVFGIVLAIDGAAYVMATVWSSCIWLFPSGGSYSICKATQECASDTERFCDSLVLIVSCLSLLFCDSGRPGKLQLFYKQEAEDMEGPLYRGGECAGFCSVSWEGVHNAQ